MIFYRKTLLVSVAFAAGALAPHAYAAHAYAGDAYAGDVVPAPETAGDTITVLATGYALPVDQAGQSISVVDAGEIAAVQGPDIIRVLDRLPGVSFAREGGVGSQTSLFVRGADSAQLLVLVDGVRVADVTSPGGGYDFGNLLSGNIARIELLRGSNSVVWGSDASGGALAITTAEVNGANASVEHGAYDTTYATASAGVKRDAYAFSLSGGWDYSQGFPAVVGGPRNDGFTQWQVSGKGRVSLGDDLALKVTGRYADGRLDIESFGASAEQWTKQNSGRVSLDYTGSALKLSGGVTVADTSRWYTSAFGPYDYLGLTEGADLTGHLALPARFALDFGADTQWARSDSTFDARQSDHLSSGHALLGWYGGVVNVAAGVRVDDHSQFGTHVTTGANGSVALGGGWRARASYGEGFKAPTLYELYDPYTGNLGLKPETSRSYDIGLEKGDRSARQHFAVTLFRRESRNLIDVDPNYVYYNIAKARAEGVEVEGDQQVTGTLRVAASYSYVRSRNLETGLDVARRPRNSLKLSADWQAPVRVSRAGGLMLGADLAVTSGSLDYYTNGPAPTPLGGHVVGTVRASLAVTDKVELFGRVENVGDAHYQTAAGYNSPGRGAWLGVRARI